MSLVKLPDLSMKLPNPPVFCSTTSVSFLVKTALCSAQFSLLLCEEAQPDFYEQWAMQFWISAVTLSELIIAVVLRAS